MVEPERPQLAIWRSFACLISKATRAQAHARARNTHTHTHARTRTRSLMRNTYTETCNTAFPHQKWFRKNAAVLRYTYITCLV
jgi:hypothetical protein